MTVELNVKPNFTSRILAFLLIVALAPVFAVISLAILVNNGRPILFSQTRVGLGGKSFRILKFRTMRPDRAGARVTSSTDTRITRLGLYLRFSKLDELPQLFNIGAGDMSFVGPRPEVPHFAAYWNEGDRAAILSVRPGLIDPAILELKDEEAILAAHPDPERAYRELIMPRKIAIYRSFAANGVSGRRLRLIVELAAFLQARVLGRKSNRSFS
jgi:lipopolysaccharide/colanic/teichoic acid biosynthesis glycosyltransferase